MARAQAGAGLLYQSPAENHEVHSEAHPSTAMMLTGALPEKRSELRASTMQPSSLPCTMRSTCRGGRQSVHVLAAHHGTGSALPASSAVSTCPLGGSFATKSPSSTCGAGPLSTGRCSFTHLGSPPAQRRVRGKTTAWQRSSHIPSIKNTFSFPKARSMYQQRGALPAMGVSEACHKRAQARSGAPEHATRVIHDHFVGLPHAQRSNVLERHCMQQRDTKHNGGCATCAAYLLKVTGRRHRVGQGRTGLICQFQVEKLRTGHALLRKGALMVRQLAAAEVRSLRPAPAQTGLRTCCPGRTSTTHPTAYTRLGDRAPTPC